MKQPEPEGKPLWYSKKDLMRLFDASDRTIERWVKQGTIPKPATLSAKWKRWPRHVIDQLLKDLGAEPD